MDKWILGVVVSVLIGLFFFVVTKNIEVATELAKIKSDIEHLKSSTPIQLVPKRKLIGDQ